MKITPVISLAIIAAISTNAFALQINKGKLISHKEWSTAGAKASYLPGTKTPDSIQQNNFTGRRISSTNSFVVADTESASTTVNTPVTISNDGYVGIYNASDKPENYIFVYSICANHSDNITDCVYSEDRIELSPHGSAYDSRKPSITLQYDKPGIYHMYADAFYTHNNLTILNSSSVGTITVS